jgi:mannose-6-phosphate isomerase-like protein (cupin superfamily)
MGSAEVVGDAPDRRVKILSDDDSLDATWSCFAPGREGADLHVHREHTDLFYVLQGELTVRLGLTGEGVVVPAGTLARVPAGVVHGFRNGGAAELRHLNFHAPGRGFADYMRALRDGRSCPYDQFEPPDDGGRDPSDAVIGHAEVVVDVPGLRATLLADVEDVTIAEVTAAPGRGLRVVALPGYPLTRVRCGGSSKTGCEGLVDRRSTMTIGRSDRSSIGTREART